MDNFKFGLRGQQEIVGFVLIVVLVVIGLMVFLIIAFNNSEGDTESVAVDNMLDVLMRTTTGCAIEYVPNYDDFEDLFKSCVKGKSCSNLDESACDYLDEHFREVVSSMIKSDSSIVAWNVEFFVDEGEGILKWNEGNCTSTHNGAQRNIVNSGKNLVVRMRLCNI